MKAEKDIKTGKWLIQYRYTDWQGNRKNQQSVDLIQNEKQSNGIGSSPRKNNRV